MKNKLFLYLFVFCSLMMVFCGLSLSLNDNGGYIIGVEPNDEGEALNLRNKDKQVEFLSEYLSQDRETKSDLKNKVVISDSRMDKDAIVDNYRKRLSAKDKKIEFLQSRIKRLEKKIKEQEESLYLSGHGKKEFYMVKKGDSLWKIAAKKKIYGNPKRWITIYNANMDRIKNPNLIYAGQLFEIHRS